MTTVENHENVTNPATDHSFARLAKRISSWTTNGVLTAIVLVTGLAFGRQVLRWWAADPETPADSARPTDDNDPLGDPRQIHVMEFGNQPWTVGHQLVTGDQTQAMAKLRGMCGKLLRRNEAPAELPPLEPALGTELSRLKPADEEPGKWKLYELNGPFPLMVGTRQSGDAKTGPPLAESGARVVIWGLAVPAAPRAWTLYAFQPSGEAGTPSKQYVPIPPSGRRILAAGVAGSATVTAFAGDPRPSSTGPGASTPESWQRFYQDWFTEHGWTVVAAWQRSQSRWHAKYAGRIAGAPFEADIEFAVDNRPGQGGLSGMLVVAPAGK